MAAGTESKAVAAPDRTARRKRRSPAEIRARLLDAAREQFQQRGYAGATTATIARQADVAEIQMFRYFSSKADLFREAVFAPLVDHFRAFTTEHNPEAIDDTSIRERAQLYVEELQAFLREHATTLVSLFIAQTHSTPGPAAPWPGGDLQSFFEDCAGLMSARAGSSTDADPGKVVRVAFAALLGCVTYRDWLFPGEDQDRAAIDAVIRDFILAGIAPHSDLVATR